MTNNNFGELKFLGLEKALREEKRYIIITRNEKKFREVKVKMNSKATEIYTVHINLIPALVIADIFYLTGSTYYNNPSNWIFTEPNAWHYENIKSSNEYDSHLDFWACNVSDIKIEIDPATNLIKSSVLDLSDNPIFSSTGSSLVQSLLSLDRWISEQEPEEAIYLLHNSINRKIN